MTLIVLGALLGAASAAFWLAVEPLGASSAALVVAAHAAAGVVAALACRALLPPRSGVRVRALVLFALVGLLALPAVLSELPLSALHALPRAAATALAGALALAVSLLAGRVLALWAIAAVCAVAALSAGALQRVEPAPVREALAATSEGAVLGRVAVIGIDGGDWRVIDPLIAKGELPNLAGLVRRGRSAVFESIDPMYSPVVWSSIFSGKTPDKHGITGWYTSHAGNRRASMLWNIVGASGADSIVSNVPGTWPPSPVKGALVSGFPMPGVVEMPELAQSQYLGGVVTSAPRAGLVPTYSALAADGAALAEVSLGEARRPSDRIRLRHYGVELEPRGWSPWVRSSVSGQPVLYRLRRLAGDALWITPPFQDPAAPLLPFTSSPELAEVVAQGDAYPVEGAGWRAADDRDVRAALFEHLADVERRHGAGVLRLLDRVPEARLVAHIITLTDRVSHAFWRFHDPAEYAPLAADELAESAPFVAESYREADRQLGQILARLGEEFTVFVVSDHGFRAEPRSGHGDHRKEGILVAAGPGIAPAAERGTVGALDLTPTILAGLGLPVGKDMDGRVRPELFAQPPAARAIATYESGEGPVSEVRIEGSTEEQLRSLGYVE